MCGLLAAAIFYCAIYYATPLCVREIALALLQNEHVLLYDLSQPSVVILCAFRHCDYLHKSSVKLSPLCRLLASFYMCFGCCFNAKVVFRPMRGVN